MDNKDFNKNQLEWYKKEIEWTDKEIKWLNDQIKEERAICKSISQDPDSYFYGKDFESVELKQYKKDRARQYRQKRFYKQMLKRYIELVKEDEA